jgi:hypothetical protein
MNDEEWAASRLRKEQFQKLAKNPTDNMTVYRMQGGAGDSLGIHWTTDQNVAHYTGLGGGAGETERTVHRATVDRSQIISRSEWMGGNIRSHYTDKGEFKTGTSQWGFDNEAEVRLRPGATVRDHATAAQGVHDYTPSGREPTIEHRGAEYVDLAHHAVQGTPEAERLHMQQQRLPHIQQAMFDPVQSYDNPGHDIGYTPKLDLWPGGSAMQQIGAASRDVDRISEAAGLGEDGAFVNSARQPLLSELRHTPVSQPEPPHHRVANQMQFKGF